MEHSKFILECCNCGRQYTPRPNLYLCPECSKTNDKLHPPHGVFTVKYDYDKVKKSISAFVPGKPFMELLPINNAVSLPPLRIGDTPLYTISTLNGNDLPFTLHLKDDSQNPTFSFKDRASAIVSAYAKEMGISTIVAASTGNAGSSLAGICASQHQRAIILVPETAPIAKLTQIVMYGATIVPVAGTYDQAFDLSIELSEKYGWYNRNTAFNPLTIEGKKTAALELYLQLNRSIPDRIFVPVGDGAILAGIYKGFEDLLRIGLIERLPVIVAVQATGSSNLVSNLKAADFTVTPSVTVADSIAVDIPRNFHMAKQYINRYSGESITVSDSDILNASRGLSRNTGLFTEPAAAAAMAGMLKYYQTNRIAPNSSNVVLLTGCGLKDLQAVSPLLNLPSAVKPDLEHIAGFIENS